MKPKPATHDLVCDSYEGSYIEKVNDLTREVGVCTNCSMWESQHPIWKKKPTVVMLQRMSKKKKG